MLEVKYDMRTGHYTPIPNEPHYLVISHADKLTATEKAKLRLLIIKQKLDISLAESVVSSPIASEHVIEQLTLFQHERRHLRPKISATFLAWLLIFLMFALPIGIAYQFSKSVCISMDRIFNSNNIAQSRYITTYIIW
jgi:Fe2+ transport system protein B